MMGNTKAVKILGLTDTLCKLVGEIRKAELKASERFRKILTHLADSYWCKSPITRPGK